MVVLDDTDLTPATAQQVHSFIGNQTLKNITVASNPRSNKRVYGQGWFLQQLVMFWADNFTDAPYIGFVDDDTVFTRAVQQHNLFDEQGRPRVIIRYFSGNFHTHVAGWYEQSYFAFQKPAYINAMTNFPIIIKRAHLPLMREAILLVHNVSNFDEFYLRMKKRGVFSQFVIMFDYIWREHREEYSWHFEPNTLGGPYFPNGYPIGSNISKEHHYLQRGSPEENGVTPEMLRPFPRCTNHGLKRKHVERRNPGQESREIHVSKIMREGYCFSQPLQTIMPSTENKNQMSSNLSILAGKWCDERFDIWNDTNVENEWMFGGLKLWAQNDPNGTLWAHRDLMSRNEQRTWDLKEMELLFSN
jgi:hypothetical protein